MNTPTSSSSADPTQAENTNAYPARQRAYHFSKLQQRWACDTHPSRICVLTDDDQHFIMDNRSLTEWLDKIVLFGIAKMVQWN
ncbi:hypothetical protein M422DRAFT_254344 [Sphaerobolus stellatus SS14]|uniref:Uncharacterized protein n=1 Tax=Sphaerobolus stellatus (strain SS14) TaxID=990650 RepID=A0A0C9VVC3_SPHS4|nr:hypothetical protein M422DRAFT_254344 [Sphaerobolus stellatus SS14]